MTPLSVIVVSWNAREFLRSCLDSLFRYPARAGCEVIVVDNSSNDGSQEMVRREFPAVQLLENPANLGFAAAGNRGAAAVAGRYLLFLNSDARIHAGTLDGALAFMKRHPRTGVMGCRTLNSDGSPQGTALGFPSPLRIFANVSGLSGVLRASRFRRHGRRRRSDYIQGSFLIIRRDVFDRCHGFDERFFLYGEDADLCLRVREAGLTIEYEPAVTITHHGGGSSARDACRLVHFIPGCLTLYGKHRGPLGKKRLALFIRLALAVRLLAGLLASPSGFRERRRETKDLLVLLAAAGSEGCR